MEFILGQTESDDVGESFHSRVKKFEEPEAHDYLYGILTLSVGAINIVLSLFLLLMTVTNPREYMRTCEKVLIYNMTFPDLINSLFFLVVLGPAKINSLWPYTEFQTVWLAFIHTFSIFHAHVAVCFICHVITLSMTYVYKFEETNRMKYMVLLAVGSICLTVCFCALPATERVGYTLMENWMGPGFNIHFEYGSKFMVAGLVGLLIPLDLYSFIQLLQVRSFFKQHRGKITERALVDLEQIIVFNIIAVFNTFLLFPVLIGIKSPLGMLLARSVMMLCPAARVMAITMSCPHFRFSWIVSSRHDDVDEEMAELSAPQKEDYADLDEKIQRLIQGTFNKSESSTAL